MGIMHSDWVPTGKASRASRKHYTSGIGKWMWYWRTYGRSWNCKKIGHLAKVCTLKAADTTQKHKEADYNTTNATSEAQNTNTGNECTKVTWSRRKIGKTHWKLRWNPTRRPLRKLPNHLQRTKIHYLFLQWSKRPFQHRLFWQQYRKVVWQQAPGKSHPPDQNTSRPPRKLPWSQHRT